MFQRSTFQKYAPNPNDVFDAHSIYFEVLGEQGWIGLLLFLSLALMTWRTCGRLNNEYRRMPGKMWISDLAAMVQVSLIGYYVSGAFLGLAYFDYYYDLIAVSIILSKLATEPDSSTPPQGHNPYAPASTTHGSSSAQIGPNQS